MALGGVFGVSEERNGEGGRTASDSGLSFVPVLSRVDTSPILG